MPKSSENDTSVLAQIRLPRSQTQAMRLLLDYLKSKHYFYQSGWIRIDKLPAFAIEMHAKIGIGMTRHQRDYARKQGHSCGHLVIVKPLDQRQIQEFGKVNFYVLWSQGEGELDVFPKYKDARKPYQRLYFETAKRTEHDGWEISRIYKLTQLEHRKHVAKNSKGEMLVDEDGQEIMSSGGRHLTWVISKESFNEAKALANELIGRFLSSHKKLTPQVANSILIWLAYQQKRPGFYGINQQRYQLKCMIWSALKAAENRRDADDVSVQVLFDSIYTALKVSPPDNPGRSLAWSEETIEQWFQNQHV
ncbi:hypothetical protein RGU72_10200 [Undibacterium sp. 5I1]|uniref:hypothetical protein n=1 Tax=Undibacterium sp. 5I1 TaxID=3048590 RepID=UPI002AB3CEA4|nr:hypothetical protein [Undibacterium sp. 5I1]MDY7538628.1 hypothetical protein [Undibacterium sp. 5I1]MEB0258130.1 hypothetical protein [Undibacterium sp. 5I1]